MAINEVKLQGLEPKDKAYQEPDGGGLFVEVLTNGTKMWRLRYRLADKEKVTLGKYPTYSLAEARQWRTDCLALIKLGLSPRALKRGDITPNDVKPEAKELADAFLNSWCWVMVEKNKIKDAGIKDEDTLEAFAQRLDAEIAELSKSKPTQKKDAIPTIGGKQITDTTVTDILIISDKDIDRGADQMALQNRNVLKRLFAYVYRRKSKT